MSSAIWFVVCSDRKTLKRFASKQEEQWRCELFIVDNGKSLNFNIILALPFIMKQNDWKKQYGLYKMYHIM